MDLHRENTPAANGGQVTAVRQISGRKLSRRRNRISRKLLVRLALELQGGGAHLYNLTAKQACWFAGVTVGELTTAGQERR
jgi:hypothetical protein